MARINLNNQRLTQARRHMIRHIQALDIRLFQALHRSSHFFRLNTFARAVSKTGDGWLYLIIMPLSILLLQPQAGRPLMLAAAGGFALERCAYYILKNTLKRPRPTEAIKDFRSWIKAADRFSLPSGHTSAAFFVATFLSFGVSLLLWPLYIWAIAVGLSRVILGVHFPSDIIAGASIGILIALFVI